MKKKTPIWKSNIKRSNGDSEDERINVYREGRTIYFFHEILHSSACEFFKLMDEVEKEKSNKPIDIIINSEGGNIYDGLAIYDRIRQSEIEINTRGYGYVASMAIIIFLAGDYRYVSLDTSFMSHQGIDEAEGKLTDLEISIKETKRLEEVVVNIISEHTGLTETRIKKDFKLGDYYFDADKALEDGYVHQIIQNKRIIKRRRKNKANNV